MHLKLKSILGLLTLLSAFGLQPSAFCQQPPPTVFQSLQDVFDAHDTNSLMYAGEINLTPLFKWDSETKSAGGAAKIDWWVSDQQGAFFQFEEYASTRASYWSMGYQARTVFKGLEVSLALGTRQNTDDPLGDVQLFITPTITKQIYAKGNWDIRLAIGCDVYNNGAAPNPFFGITFRALR